MQKWMFLVFQHWMVIVLFVVIQNQIFLVLQYWNACYHPKLVTQMLGQNIYFKLAPLRITYGIGDRRFP